jgi:hypothetical protein
MQVRVRVRLVEHYRITIGMGSRAVASADCEGNARLILSDISIGRSCHVEVTASKVVMRLVTRRGGSGTTRLIDQIGLVIV